MPHFILLAQAFTSYFFLSLVYSTWLACQPEDAGLIAVFRRRGWKYFLLALIDAEANFLIVKAYQYTTLTSIQVIIQIYLYWTF